jgi:malate dehydrogenase
MKDKIAFYGAGNVGATAAHWLANMEIGDCVLFDIFGQVAAGKALDLFEAGPPIGYDGRVQGGNEAGIIEGADVIVVTAGVPRKKDPVTGKFPSRDELVKINQEIMEEVSTNIKNLAPDSIIIVVSNPLDAMCHVVKHVTGFPRERVIGMAGALDTARYKTFIAAELGVSVEDVHGMVLGGHGDTMVPLVSYTTVSGIPISQLLGKPQLDAIVQRARNGGAEIVALLKTGSAYYAPSSATVQMVEAIALDRKRILPCAAWLEGEYGLSGMFCGVPCKLGRRGLEQIVEVQLSAEERAALHKSADAVKQTMAAVQL